MFFQFTDGPNNLIYMNLLGKIWRLLPAWLRTRITRISQRTFTVSVAAVITNDAGQVLLLDHVLRPASGWGIPGGFIGFGEQPEDALRREVAEETGIELTDVRLYRIRTLKRHVEILFLARSVGDPTVLSREIVSLGWFTAEDLPAAMNVGQQNLIREILRTES